MKNKFLLVVLLMLFSCNYGFSQSQDCLLNFGLFVEDAKAGNYANAYEPWTKVFSECPEYHYATFAYGELLLKNRIKEDPANKKKYEDQLMQVYKKGPELFPDKLNKTKNDIDIALLMNDQGASDEDIYNLLDNAFKNDPDNFENPKALYLYFSTLVNLHEAGKKDLQEVFDTYDVVTAKIEEENQELSVIMLDYVQKEEAGKPLTKKDKQMYEAAQTNGASYEKISQGIDSKLGKLADCENLIPLYNKNFDTKKSDAKWLNAAAARMEAKGCTSDPLFVKMVEALDALEPSASSKYYLGSLYEQRGEDSKAMEYFMQSIDLETDKYKKSNKLLGIAVKANKRGQTMTAYKYARQALDANPAQGQAYLLIADLYHKSANECGETVFDKKAVNWKAAEMARKAAQVDPSLKSRASQAAAGYEGRAPTKSEIFNSGMAGKVIPVKCWIGGSIKVPNL
ncbi:hypothetical protein [Robertkochia solimangrovi]|uniref:hypothetical protein n=1 Tax=Robertkochia solimangrovi TaxID=2213046 RepID=UPI001180C53B|nr:hypothetical protein [Robertkochia solimangrovi]TRZ43255.1 hypothetical protein DMZ48_11240 [Robertkochia solimangrovi]